MITVFGHTFEHLTIVRAIGNPVYIYVVQAESGWCIRLETETGFMYKRVSTIYETDDFTKIAVIPESEVPEGEEINGDGNETVTE